MLKDFRPVSQLVTRVTDVTRPRFPVIDAHNHLADPLGGGWDKRPVGDLLHILDQAGVRRFIDLDGGWGELLLHQHLDRFKAAAPERFCVFGGVDWTQWQVQGPAFPDWAAHSLRLQRQRGAEGLKIWKGLGLSVKDSDGHLVSVDDPRLDPIWQTAGELRLPVMIHVADPVAFFDPI
ncbi:MAG: hypothetical protein MUO23_03895, partial [Anaerolineales bacterium]|nr:hypothetical protein [Anaerolineales bacterium]